MLRSTRPSRTRTAGPVTPLARVRRVALVCAIASVVLATVQAQRVDQPPGLAAGALLAGWVLCASWIVGERRGRFTWPADAVEVPALLVLLLAAPGDPFVPLFGLALRSLYGRPLAAACRYLVWVAVLLVAHSSRDVAELHADLDRGLGLALVPLVFQLLVAAMDRLQASERRLASLVRNSSDIVTVVDAGLNVIWQADSIRTVLGHEPDDVRGTSVLQLVHPDDRPLLLACVADAERAADLTRTLQLRLRHATAGYRDFEVIVANRLHDPDVCGLTLNMRDATEPRELERELRRVADERESEALHDPLTGLANRRKLFAELGDLLEAAELRHVSLGLLIIDVKGFKELNDTLGHHAGDELLVELGTRLAASAPETSVVARLGGDVFAIVLAPGTTLAAAARVATRVGAAIERPAVVAGITVRVGSSAGIAMYPDNAPDLSTLVQRADIAMYCAKADGVGHAVYDVTRDDSSTERLTLMAELPAAMAGDQLVVLYQPKVDLATGHVCGAEALVRWEHPTRGTLTPDVFLPLLERAGLMPALTLEVLERSLVQCGRWAADGLDLGIAVNLAAANLVDLTFPDRVDQLLCRHDVAASALTLEVTETIVGGDSPQVIDVLRRLRDIGVKLSLDDFGTGTSSLSFLRRLPVNELKIDKSFVLGMAEHAQDRAIVRTITQLAHDLGVLVVAEGIETPAVRDLLRADGCDRGQGFLIGRPMPADDLTRLVRRAASGSLVA